jgi:steroid 5-alpha reductase family enzyme
MKSKVLSLLVILLIYVIAVFIGIATFNNLDWENLIYKLLVANVVATLFIFGVGLLLKNASLYDPYWSVAPPILLILTHIHLETSLNTVRFFIYIGLIFWSIRLTYNWAINWTGFEEQDWRYTLIKERAPKIYLISNLFGIHLMPTVIVFIQLLGSIELLVISTTANLISMIGLVIMILSATLQFIADAQMRAFKKRNLNKKECIEEGLWKYSRHPNYFGEVMVWWGLYLIYFGSTQSINLYLLAPLAMTSLFIFISIPMMEKKILRTRPEYEGYQDRVSMLIPLPRKEKDTNSFENA